MTTGFHGLVFLIGGSSGTGKSVLARRLGREWGIPALQVDDFRLVLKDAVERAVESQDNPPELWDHLGLGGLRDVQEVYADPGASPELRFQALRATAEAMSKAVEIVIAHHIATQTPIILEGDGLLPSLLTRHTVARLPLEPGQLRGIFLVEDDENRLFENALQRGRGFKEGPLIEQRNIIRTSWLFGQWIKTEAASQNIPVIPSHPFDTLFNRVIRVLEP